MLGELVRDRDCSAHLGYLYELEGLRLLEPRQDPEQARANFREALSQWRDALETPAAGKQPSPAHEQLVRFGLSDSLADTSSCIAARRRACSVLAERSCAPASIDPSDKPGNLVLAAYLALPDKARALQFVASFTRSSNRFIDIHRQRETELRVLQVIATRITFVARGELELTTEMRRRLLTSVQEAVGDHAQAEFLLHLFLLISHSCDVGFEENPTHPPDRASVLAFRRRFDS